MPDGDVISSRIPYRWRSTLDCLRGGGTPSEIVAHASRALTKTFRESGGIEGLAAYGAVVDARVRGELTAAEARLKARLVYDSQEQVPRAQIVFRAVYRLLAMSSEGAALQPGAITVAEAVSFELLQTELFEPVRAKLIGKFVPDDEAFDRLFAECRTLLAPGVARISASLSLDPSARGLRAAPTRRRQRRLTTAALLDQSII